MSLEGHISVSILSCNRLLRETIARILTYKRNFNVVAVEPPGLTPGGIELARTPDVWVSDSLYDFAKQLLPYLHERKEKSVACVLIAMPDDAKQFLTAVSYGVLGYVLQEASPIDVIAAIRAVARGEAVCPPHLARVLFDFVASQKSELQNGRATKQFRLTRREQQLVPLVGRGLTNKEIATHLNVSEQTIKTHIHRILRKTGVEDRFAISAACDAVQIGI